MQINGWDLCGRIWTTSSTNHRSCRTTTIATTWQVWFLYCVVHLWNKLRARPFFDSFHFHSTPWSFPTAFYPSQLQSSNHWLLVWIACLLVCFPCCFCVEFIVHTCSGAGNGPHQFHMPYQVQFMEKLARGNLLIVADYFNRRISLWSPDGAQHLSTTPLNALCRGLAVDMDGFLLVACEQPGVIQVLEPCVNFRLITTISPCNLAEGHDPADSRPTGLCVSDENTLMVVDFWQNRVQFFDWCGLIWVQVVIELNLLSFSLDSHIDSTVLISSF